MDEIKFNGFETHLYGVDVPFKHQKTLQKIRTPSFSFFSKIHIEIPITACVCHNIVYFYTFEPYDAKV